MDQVFCILCAFLEFDAGVEIFRVFPNYSQINIFISFPCTLKGFTWSQTAKQVKRLSQSDVDTPEPCSDRRGDWSLKGYFVFSDRINDSLRQGCSFFFEYILPCLLDVPPDIYTSGFNYLFRGLRAFRAYAISRYECNGIHYRCGVSIFFVSSGHIAMNLNSSSVRGCCVCGWACCVGS